MLLSQGKPDLRQLLDYAVTDHPLSFSLLSMVRATYIAMPMVSLLITHGSSTGSRNTSLPPSPQAMWTAQCIGLKQSGMTSARGAIALARPPSRHLWMDELSRVTNFLSLSPPWTYLHIGYHAQVGIRHTFDRNLLFWTHQFIGNPFINDARIND